MDNKAISKFLLPGSLYKFYLDPILSKDDGFDAESLTNIALKILQEISLKREWPGLSFALKNYSENLQIKDKRLEQNIFNCHFLNPIGLAAGFDKNGIAAGIWDLFGFGFAELGTVTFHPQAGNPRPRLFRLAKEKAALNRMGFNNNGAEKMLEIIKKQEIQDSTSRPITLGINLGKSKITPIDQANEDYAASLGLLAKCADYAVINVSSPNTPGLRDLQSPKYLRNLIKRLKEVANCPPLLVKIAPDLNNDQLDQLALVALEEKIDGIIAINTSLDRLGLENRIIKQTGNLLINESGGLSGSPLRVRALDVIHRLRSTTKGSIPLIGVGGINSPESAWERITAGASLIQVYTGWIFQGPELVPSILEGILSQLEKHGFNNISEAVGSNIPWVHH